MGFVRVRCSTTESNAILQHHEKRSKDSKHSSKGVKFKSKIDKETGQTYFINTKTKETHWELPAGGVITKKLHHRRSHRKIRNDVSEANDITEPSNLSSPAQETSSEIVDETEKNTEASTQAQADAGLPVEVDDAQLQTAGGDNQDSADAEETEGLDVKEAVWL